MPDLSTIRHERERQFAAAFFDHDEWEHEPGPYLLSNGTKYIPDFKDNRRNVLIEVVGSQQAYSQNKDKYASFAAEYHDKILEFRDCNGKKLSPCNGKLFGRKEHDHDGEKTIFDVLREKFGTDANVARQIGITARHYSRLKTSERIKPSILKLMNVYANNKNQEDQACDGA